MSYLKIRKDSFRINFNDYIYNIDEVLKLECEKISNFEHTKLLEYCLEGGKRIRPIIMILSAEGISKKNSESINSAACVVELLHTVSLIHDDYVDKSTTRRGKNSYYIKFGNIGTISIGKFVMGLILDICYRKNLTCILSELSNMVIQMCKGEIVESKLRDKKISFDDYLHVIEMKTAISFEKAAKIGAIIAGGNQEQIRSFSNFGKLLGTAYQLRDDLDDWKNGDGLLQILNDNESKFEHELLENQLSKIGQEALNEIQKMNLNTPAMKLLVALLLQKSVTKT